MAFVITQPCIGVKDASCLEVCPADCIATTDDAEQYFIDPAECIDCGACMDTCPVDAIYPEDEGPPEYTQFVKVNGGLVRLTRRAIVVSAAAARGGALPVPLPTF